MDRLQYRCSYVDSQGQTYHIWSDPREPMLECFDLAFEEPKSWVGANDWLMKRESIKKIARKLNKNQERHERENREPQGPWNLQVK